MHGRGICLLGPGAVRSGQGRRRCRDLFISRVSTERPIGSTDKQLTCERGIVLDDL